jgi:hypothetical protein
MNIREGARRIQFVGRSLLYFAGTLLVLGMIASLVGHLTAGSSYRDVGLVINGAVVLAVIAVYFALPGIALLVLGWIVDGFGKPSAPYLGD